MADFFSRRQFMANSGAAALPLLWAPAGATALSLVGDKDYKYTPNPALEKIKLGIIGVGGRGNALLGEILKTQQADVVAICDIRPIAIEMASARCVGMSPKGYTDYRKLLDDKGVDVVVIATPVDLHGEMAEAAMDADKHIYCEKPVGICGQVTSKFYERAKDYKKAFQFGFQWMYNRDFRAAIEAVHDGVIGGVRYIHAQRHGGDLPRDKGKDWLFDRSRSGDIIVEQAVHEMNVFCWGLKSHPIRANGFGGINNYINEPAGRTIMDHYSLSYDCPGPVHISYSHLYYAHGLGGSHIHFFGDKGAVSVMDGQVYMADGSAPPAPREMKLTGEDTFNAFLSFFDDIRSGSKPLAGPERGYIATLTCILGRQAVYGGGTATWAQALATGPDWSDLAAGTGGGMAGMKGMGDGKMKCEMCGKPKDEGKDGGHEGHDAKAGKKDKKDEHEGHEEKKEGHEGHDHSDAGIKFGLRVLRG